MNDAIETVAGSYGHRVVFVDIAAVFVGHEAPNGLGPDGLREGDFWIIGDLVGGLVGDVHPYCARGDTLGDPWINSVDCVHPDVTGTAAIADLVLDAILP